MDLSLKSFRCYDSAQFSWSNNTINLIDGRSAVGKTTLLEAIYWCLYGKITKVRPYDNEKAATSVQIKISNSLLYLVIERSTVGSKISVTDLKNDRNYRGGSAQELINYYFGRVSFFNSCCYISQSEKHVLIAGSKADKLACIDRLAFKNSSPAQMISQVSNDLLGAGSTVTELENQLKVKRNTLQIEMNTWSIESLPTFLIEEDFDGLIKKATQDYEEARKNNVLLENWENIWKEILNFLEVRSRNKENVWKKLRNQAPSFSLSSWKPELEQEIETWNQSLQRNLEQMKDLLQHCTEMHRLEDQLTQKREKSDFYRSHCTGLEDTGKPLQEYAAWQISQAQEKERKYSLQVHLASKLNKDYATLNSEEIEEARKNAPFLENLKRARREAEYLKSKLYFPEGSAEDWLNARKKYIKMLSEYWKTEEEKIISKSDLDVDCTQLIQSLLSNWNYYRNNLKVMNSYPQWKYTEESINDAREKQQSLHNLDRNIQCMQQLCSDQNISLEQGLEIVGIVLKSSSAPLRSYSATDINRAISDTEKRRCAVKKCAQLELPYNVSIFEKYDYTEVWNKLQLLQNYSSLLQEKENLEKQAATEFSSSLDQLPRYAQALQEELLNVQNYQEDQLASLSLCLNCSALECPVCQSSLRLNSGQLILDPNFDTEVARNQYNEIYAYRNQETLRIRKKLDQVARLQETATRVCTKLENLKLPSKLGKKIEQGQLNKLIEKWQKRLDIASQLRGYFYIDEIDLSAEEMRKINFVLSMKTLSEEYFEKKDLLEQRNAIRNIARLHYLDMPSVEEEELQKDLKYAHDFKYHLQLEQCIPENTLHWKEGEIEEQLQMASLEVILLPEVSSEEMQEQKTLKKQRETREQIELLEQEIAQIEDDMGKNPLDQQEVQYFALNTANASEDLKYLYGLLQRCNKFLQECKNRQISEYSELKTLADKIEEYRKEERLYKLYLNLGHIQGEINNLSNNLAQYQHYYNKLAQLKAEMNEAEYISYNSTVQNINAHLELILADIFEDSNAPLTAYLSMFRQLKSKDQLRPEVNISVFRSGVEISHRQISGGEHQRLSLALTLACLAFSDTSLVMLDEFLPGLPEEDQEICVRVLSRYIRRSDRIVLCINHGGIGGWYDQAITLTK